MKEEEKLGIYEKMLRDVEELRLPPSLNDTEHFDVYQNYEIEAEKGMNLVFLNSVGIGTLYNGAARDYISGKILDWKMSAK